MATRTAMHTKAVGPEAQPHDMGLTPEHSSATERFEVDGANAARDFLRSHGISPKFRRTDFCSVIRGSRWNG